MLGYRKLRPALKGLVHKLVHSESQGRASSLKNTWSSVRKLLWLILGWMPARQLSVGNFSRDRRANPCHYFFVSFILLSFHPGRQAINLTVSINLVNTFGPTPNFPWGPTLPNLSTPNRTPWGSDISSRQSQSYQSGSTSEPYQSGSISEASLHTPEHL